MPVGSDNMLFYARAQRNDNYDNYGHISYTLGTEGTTADGTLTHYVFYAMAPLRASTLNILKLRLNDVKGLETEDPDVVIDTDYTWREGADYHPVM